MTALLALRDVSIAFDTPRGSLQAVRSVDLDVPAGESVGIGHVGAGLEYRFTENIGLFVDGRWVYSPQIDGGALARTGLRFAF